MIRMNNFTRDPEVLKNAMLDAVQRVLRSGHYILGPEVETFEEEWATACGVPHCVGVGNGLDAIELGLRAMDIGEGDEVITPSMTAFATVLGIMRAGATPVFADIDPETALVNPDSVRRCLGPHTRAILVVHLYGRVCPMDAFEALASESGVPIIEDCAQAHGAPVGRHGAFSAWSFYPTKNLGAVGDAGAVTTRSYELATRVRALRHYGQVDRGYHTIRGMNSRLDEVQAAILRARLPWLEPWNTRRREIANTYLSKINAGVVQALPSAAEHAWHLFVLRSENRDVLKDRLASKGVESIVHYPMPAHRQGACSKFRMDSAGLVHTERHAETCLSLPCHPYLTDQEVESVITAVG